jgi:hypothetical protein
MAGCAAPQESVPIRVEQKEWRPAPGVNGVELKTDHYQLWVTAKDPVLREHLPIFLETAFREYQELVPLPRQRTEKLTVYLFETKAQWAQFTRRFTPLEARVYLHIQEGAYMDHRTATTVAYDLGRDRTLSLLGHEGFHQYLSACFPDTPPAWLNEGLATQWEAFELKRDRPVFTQRRNFLRRNSLREALSQTEAWIPLRKLLAMHAGQAVVETGQATRSYYAQVWALALFLRQGENGAYAERLGRLLGDLGDGRVRAAALAYRVVAPGAGDISVPEAVFRHYVTEDLAGFEAAYIEFARRLVG